MPVRSTSLLEALNPDASLWPGPLAPAGNARLDAALAELPDEVAEAVLSGIVDPERNDWARGALLGVSLARTAGARVTGMATDDLLDMVSARDERFGLAPLGFRLPAHRWGDPRDVARMLSGLDATFGDRRFVLYLRRPVPANVDTGPINRAVHLWLSAIDRGDRDERPAVYEDGDVAIDLTLAAGEGRGGRVLTIGPVTTLERLGAVDARLMDTLVRQEESIGDVPVVVVLAADRSWGLSRGYVQQLLYGTPDRVACTHGDSGSSYEAVFNPNGRSLFSDPACRSLAALWWVEPDPQRADPLAFRARSHENPWAEAPPEVAVLATTFRRVGEVQPDRRVTMNWGGR